MGFNIDNSTAILFEEEIIPKVIPPMILFTILTILGVTGNAAVIYIFGFSLKGSTVHFFITLLAIFDFVYCSVGFSMGIMEFYTIFRYPSKGNCKFQRFVTFSCGVGSAIMFLAISIERYRIVCRDARSDLSSRHRKIFTAVGVALSLAAGLPSLYYSQRLQFTPSSFPNITGVICGVLPSKDNPSPYYYFYTFISLISVASITMLILYYQVWRRAKKHFTMRYNRQQNDSSVSADPSVALTHLGRTNRTVIATTVLFAFTFFIHVLLSFLLPRFLHGFSAEVAYITFLTFLTYLSGAFNPVVYACFNAQFRYEIKKMAAKILRTKDPKTEDFSTENTR